LGSIPRTGGGATPIEERIMRSAMVVVLSAAGFLGASFISQASAGEAAPPGAMDWPQWRGPDRNGVAPASPALADSWPKDGPKQVWKTGWIPGCRNGGGLAQPVVADGKVFVYTSWRRPPGGGDGAPAGNQPRTVADTILCLDAATGKEIWCKELPFDGNWGKLQSPDLGPMSTPTIWSSKCYLTGLMGLYCLSAKDGTLLWQKKGSGVHSSVAVDDGVVYGCIGTQPLSAFDAETGQLLWRCPGVESTTSSPVLWKSGGKTYVICAWWCVDAQTGKLLWKGKDWYIGAGITPVIVGDTIVMCSGAYKLAPEKPEPLWKMPANVCDPASSPLVYDGHLYWFFNWYGGDVWSCVDLKTGALKWQARSKIPASCPASSPVAVDGKIIHPIGNGHDADRFQVEMLRATPEKYDLLSAFSPGVTAFSSPAVAGGKLYLRLWDGVACYDLTK
jgi:outer membrane protein assembly factor BamB